MKKFDLHLGAWGRRRDFRGVCLKNGEWPASILLPVRFVGSFLVPCFWDAWKIKILSDVPVLFY